MAEPEAMTEESLKAASPEPAGMQPEPTPDAEAEAASEPDSDAEAAPAASAPAAPAFRVVLASNSPRRRELLEQAGVTFSVRTPEVPVDESLEPDLQADPPEAVKKLAERKAGAVVQEILADPDFRGMLVVLGADTMVVKDGEIFGKPRNVSHATHMLRQLSGATHQVHTATSVWMVQAAEDGNVSLGFRTLCDTAHVTFRDLGDEEIADYLRMGESFDKAGAYGIQGHAGTFVTRLQGSMDTVIGLPVERLLREFPDLAPQA